MSYKNHWFKFKAEVFAHIFMKHIFPLLPDKLKDSTTRVEKEKKDRGDKRYQRLQVFGNDAIYSSAREPHGNPVAFLMAICWGTLMARCQEDYTQKVAALPVPREFASVLI